MSNPQQFAGPVADEPFPSTDGSSTITLGGTAQTLFTAPAHGYEVVNPDASEDLWICDNGSNASANGTGCIRVAPNGGSYYTPINMAPLAHAVSIVGATTGHKFTARYW